MKTRRGCPHCNRRAPQTDTPHSADCFGSSSRGGRCSSLRGRPATLGCTSYRTERRATRPLSLSCVRRLALVLSRHESTLVFCLGISSDAVGRDGGRRDPSSRRAPRLRNAAQDPPLGRLRVPLEGGLRHGHGCRAWCDPGSRSAILCPRGRRRATQSHIFLLVSAAHLCHRVLALHPSPRARPSQGRTQSSRLSITGRSGSSSSQRSRGKASPEPRRRWGLRLGLLPREARAAPELKRRARPAEAAAAGAGLARAGRGTKTRPADPGRRRPRSSWSSCGECTRCGRYPSSVPFGSSCGRNLTQTGGALRRRSPPTSRRRASPCGRQ